MGRTRQRYNAKARSGGSGIKQTNVSEEEVKIDIDISKDHYDASNPLVLPGSKKKIPKVKEEKAKPLPKILSNKKRKQLERILEKKKRKINRKELLEKLKEVQAKPEELKLMTSTSDMHSYGLKRIVAEASEITSMKKPITEITSMKRSIKVNNVKGVNKKLKLDANVSSYNENSSDSESESSDTSNEEELNNDDKHSSELEVKNIEKEEEKLIETSELSESIPSQTISVANEHEGEKDKSEITTNKEIEKKSAVFVTVNRKPEIQAMREKLPVYCEEQSIIEAIKENLVVIIHGETGSGKTTQVPQFLYEAGYTQTGKIIGITEPRRIAAMTMAARVGEELDMPDKVSYHIRYEKTVGKQTEIKFMTDGVLLKELRHDFFLSKYSVIIIDEAHERSVFSDVLIGLLSRIVSIREKRNDPLKFIIMSATLRVEDFTDNPKLFKIQPFLIRLDSRQHKVQVHFNLRTPEDYVEAAYNKVCKIHSELPAGAILVFVTGEKEVQRLCKLLREAFPLKDEPKSSSSSKEQSDFVKAAPNELNHKKKCANIAQSDSFCSLPAEINLDNYSIEPLNMEDMQHQQSDDEENEPSDEGNEPSDKISNKKNFKSSSPLHVLPLYSILPFEDQEKVFKPPPEGSRLCVVSTNVAETSITIPGLKYVVDTGKVKTKVYNSYGGGISKFEITWCSKASANQRAGRCGRTEGGHCYRLYSSAVFQNEFPDFSLPEIQRIPVDDVLLQMKALGIDRVVEFPFPSPPDQEALKAAERRLVILGALQDLQKGARYKDLAKWEFSAKVTPLGKAMSRFPLSPRYAKMLLLSYKHNCIPYIIAIVCALTVPDLFLKTSTTTVTENGEEEVKVVQEGIKKIGTGKSVRLGDVMVLLRAVALFEDSKSAMKFCIKNGIRFKAMAEIHKMSIQLLREMERAFPDASIPQNMQISPPSAETLENIRKIVTACFIDQVARKLPRDETKDEKSLKNAYKCLIFEDPVFIHPASTMFERLPNYVTYNEIMRSTKLYMKGVVEIEPEWLAAFSENLCCFSDPCEEPPPMYDSEKDKIYCHMGGTFGPWQWDLPIVKMEMPKDFLKYSWFCFFFLDGQVCPAIEKYKELYLSQPSTILKSWAKMLPRTRYMLQAVIAEEVDSRKKLQKAWKKDPKYLLREFWEWLPSDKHLEVELTWPPKC
ncbi:probable ATP-dependent RNA helicase DHX37 [Trichonephila inaurata madagascariensis]|uniref:RNA helicase n=1 Tax=Trichonephila inaurata madagascariensis TaxID=2747483 RepID=A0A8X7BTD8_9ARAC|nr:probable ATP-dependent RNA helicase DHX37 [Trichonephila inaurata madagascariensis]